MDALTRLAALLVAVLLALDAFSGARTQEVRVDAHLRVARWHQDDEYRLHFAGGRVSSCRVGHTVFDAIRDGDRVEVDTSRVFKSCIGLRRRDEVLSRAESHPWLALLPIAALVAAAFGWIAFQRDRRHRRQWWFA